MKLSENDIEIMNIIWENGTATAAFIAERLCEKKGWKKPTVYTLIDRLIKKGAIEKINSDYTCRPLVSLEDVRNDETGGLLDRLYKGSAKLLVSGFIKEKRLSPQELLELKELIDSSIDDDNM